METTTLRLLAEERAQSSGTTTTTTTSGTRRSLPSLPPPRVASLAANGLRPDDDSPEVLLHNTVALSFLLNAQSWQTVTVDANTTFHLFHGVHVFAVDNLEIQFQPGSELRFHRDHRNPQRFNNATSDNPSSRPPACLTFYRCSNLTLTTRANEHVGGLDNRGLLNGGGQQWWGWPYVGYAQVLEHRPYLLLFNHTRNVQISHLVLQDAPFYHVQMTDVADASVHHVSIVSRRTKQLTHSAWDLSAFNTDGLDIAGHNVHVHDVDIWTQDDCIAVKDNFWSDDNRPVSSNMLFERIAASGLGLTIGSISGTTVQNITFRDALLYRTYKGIYAKFRAPSGSHHDPPSSLIQDILYHNVTIIEPLQYALWFGPAQQNGGHTSNPCHAAPCSLCWPQVPGAACGIVPNAIYRNITLQDISIINPRGSLGVLMGSEDYPIEGLLFKNVRVGFSNDRSDSSVNAQLLFPGLALPVEDVWIERTHRLMRLLGFLAVLGLLGCFCVRKRRRQRQQTQRRLREMEVWAPQCGRRQRWCALILLRGVLAVPVLLLALYQVRLAHRLHKVDDYFVCQGITNGVASGTTYPVPYCLQDLTEEGHAKTNRPHFWNHEAHANGWGVQAFWWIVFGLTSFWWLNVAQTGNANPNDTSVVDQPYTVLNQVETENVDVEEGDEEIFEDEVDEAVQDTFSSTAANDGQSSSSVAATEPSGAVGHCRNTLQDVLESQNGQIAVKSIGIVRSVYKLCVGTPRQGLLAPDARGYIELSDELGKDTVDRLLEYSHVWIVFLFHLNTIGQRSIAKIRPPAAGGAKVGVFATRSPHRPNPIGLTLARLVNVRTRRQERGNRKPVCVTILDIAGLDLVDGTPVLDIKPYVPVYDSISPEHPVSMPQWVSGGLNTSRPVDFTYHAEMSLVDIVQNKPLQFYKPNEVAQVRAAIVQVLRMDVRSAFQTKKARQGASHAQKSKRLQSARTIKSEVNNSTVDADSPACCTQQLDRLLIKFKVQQTPPQEQQRHASQGSGAEDGVLITDIVYLAHLPEH